MTTSRVKLQAILISWRDLLQSVAPIAALALLAILLTVHFMQPAPPHSLTISGGAPGSTFDTMAQRYRKILARNGVRLDILHSAGSIQNLQRLADPNSKVDIALVQSGIPGSGDTSNIASLGSMFYLPLTVFYRHPTPIARLSELQGKRIAVGAEGSGTRFLALALLKANGIEPGGATTIVSLEDEDARRALLHGDVDALFLEGDSASPTVIRELLHANGIRLFDFPQADAYVRRFTFLNKLSVPPGAFDLGENLPPEPVNMLAPTVELLAHADLHPALCDLLIEAAYEVHGHASLLQAAGQFPAPSTNLFPISVEADRYYKSGNKSFLYRFLPFWLASLLNRAFVVLVPVVVIVIPGLRFLPQLYNWRINGRIHRRYAELMALERESLGAPTEERRKELLERLAEIERSVISGKIPGSHADQLYILRQHIAFVRGTLTRSPAAGESA